MVTLKPRRKAYAVLNERDYCCIVGEVNTRKYGELPRYVPAPKDEHMAQAKPDTGEWERYIKSVLRDPLKEARLVRSTELAERKIQALIDHPDTPDAERQAAIRAIARKRRAKGNVSGDRETPW